MATKKTNLKGLPHPREKVSSFSELLTIKRVKNYCILLICVNALMLGFGFVRNKPLTLSAAPFGGDFIEFHTAGRILNDYGPHRLYDFQLQDKLLHEYLPDFSLPFVTPPYVAVLFAPLAHLPLKLAYLIWVVVSVALYLGAINLVLRLVAVPRRITYLICLGFPPFLMLVLAGGQISAIGCFILALWLFLMKRDREFLAGCALGLLLYKPTLVVFIVPALLFGRKLRTLIGFATMAGLLATLSIWMLGFDGLLRYVAVLREFSSLVGQGYMPATMYVDVATFIRQLFHVDIRYVTILLALPLTYLTRHNPERAFIPTLVLNSYAPVYDLILLVPVLIITYQFVSRRLLTILFVVSFFTVPICQVTGLQIVTPVLLALCYQLCVKPMVQLNSLREGTTRLHDQVATRESASETPW